MRRHITFSGRLGGGVVAVLLTLWAAGSLVGQELDRVRFGVGFVANAPSQMAGISGYVLLPVLGGIGVYADGKWDIDSPADDRAFDASRTAADLEADPSSAGTRFLKRETSWYRSFNLALVRPFNPFLMVYAGGGYAEGERYGLYQELVGEVGRALWVRDPRQDEDRVSFMAGLILRLLPVLSTQVGLETQPRGFTAGMSLRLPSW
jgi:hypothetical protein